jgi:uncharacterized protein DUF1580
LPTIPEPPVRDLLALRAEGQLLTINQARAVLGVGSATIVRWYTTGVRGVVLNSHVFGGRRMIVRADIDVFLATLQEADHAS